MLRFLILVTQFAFIIGKNVDLGVFDNLNHYQYPWLVQIAVKHSTTSKSIPICGGVLITNDMKKISVVTTAHCFFDKQGNSQPLSDFEVILPSIIDQPNTMDITNLTIHPKFNQKSIILIITKQVFFSQKINSSSTKRNDLALIELPAVMKNNTLCNQLKPLSLPEKGFVPSSEEKCYHIGYGPERELRKFSFNTTTNCNSNEHLITPWICAYHYEPGNKIDSGDSGYPLICFSNNGNIPTIYGLVSYGFSSIESLEHPVIYTDITYHVDWLSFQSLPQVKSLTLIPPYAYYTFLIATCLIVTFPVVVCLWWLFRKIRYSKAQKLNINDNINDKLLTSEPSSSSA